MSKGYIENMTIGLLGLEPYLWELTPASERRLYSGVLYCFLLFIIFSFISSIQLLFLITSSWILASLAAFPVTFIVGSVVRFTLIILRRSIFDTSVSPSDPSISSDLNIVGQSEIHTQGENPNASNTTPNNSTSKFGLQISNVFRKIVQFRLSDLRKMQWPSSRSSVPGLKFAIRIIMLSTIGLLVVFPLATIFHFDRLEEVNDSKRKMYIDQFEDDGSRLLENRTRLIRTRIDELRRSLSEDKNGPGNSRVKAMRSAELNRLKKELVIEQSNFESSYTLSKDEFLKEMNERYFLVLTFYSVISMPGFFIAVLIVTCLLFIPNLLLHILKSRRSFVYAGLSTKHYRDIIDKAYHQTEKEGYEYLLKKYGYNPVAFKKSKFWLDPPYNTVPRMGNMTRQLMSREEFMIEIEKIKMKP
jgi:hypothetical protein